MHKDGSINIVWSEVIEDLNNSRTGQIDIVMGTPGSAQVTRCRLLKEYKNLFARTEDRFLYLSLNA